jgi:hypothetical protein
MTKDNEMCDNHATGSAEPDPNAPVLSAEIQRALGSKIRAAYGELVREPLPDKFKKLLEELAQSEKKSDN